ncbi:hypothetical protein JKP88DRAFT_319862 [Tribonema minus]|uniref:Uncharacterized protein n=1 Tax=Tribonema minus TaxID=303371 RepID=A0A836CDX4_9STRA|nr:hypothetical protein JKP88DRAFT_319862 [Tribonema minus]
MFQYVLSFLCTGTLNKVPDSFTSSQWRQLQDEAAYYGLYSLTAAMAEPNPSPPLPNLQAGQPMLQCARLVHSAGGVHQRPFDRDAPHMCDITIRSSIVVVPSQVPGSLSYCITFQVPEAFNRERGVVLSDQGFLVKHWLLEEPEGEEEIDPTSAIHAHFVSRFATSRSKQQDLAMITPALLRTFQWRPVVICAGESLADALTHLLQLLCNGSNVTELPEHYEYCWAVSPICNPGTAAVEYIGGTAHRYCMAPFKLPPREPNSEFVAAFASLNAPEYMAKNVGSYWRRAADSYTACVASHKAGLPTSFDEAEDMAT